MGASPNLGAFGDFGFVRRRKIANSEPKAQSAPNVSRHYHGISASTGQKSIG
jgi:hypothetical protein